MPRQTKPLGILQVQRITAPGLHAVGGVTGLYLRISPTGGRSWVLRTTINGMRTDRGLGSCGKISLAAAREVARAYHESLLSGIDPLVTKREAAARAGVTFASAMQACLASKRAGWTSAIHEAQWERTLVEYAIPILGKMDVRDIEARHVLQCLQPHWATKNPTMQKLRPRIEAVLGYAIAHGWRKDSNPAAWKNNLESLLPSMANVVKVAHFAALPWADLPDVMRRLGELPGIGPLALQFLILTTARSMEVRGLPRVGEVTGSMWSIPANRTKSGRDHIVPLAPAALAVLSRLPAPTRHQTYLFPPARSTKPLADGVLSDPLRALGIPPEVATVHGMRSTFRDWCGDNGYSRADAEAQLQHAAGDSTERAYARTTLVARRTVLLGAWASYATGTEPASDNVVLMKSTA